MNHDRTSPWPDIPNQAVVFLLDVRDDFEARLLRDWVEAERPGSDAPPRHRFIELPRGHADNLMGAVLAEDDDIWLQPLRIAWLPAARKSGRFFLQDLFFGRITEPGRMRRRWLAQQKPEQIAYIVGDGAWQHELSERLCDDETLGARGTRGALQGFPHPARRRFCQHGLSQPDRECRPAARHVRAGCAETGGPIPAGNGGDANAVHARSDERWAP